MTFRCVEMVAISVVFSCVVCIHSTAAPQQRSPSGLPDWVPIYPGGKVSGVETRKAGIETYTKFQLDAAADCRKVLAWYQEQMRVAGFSVGSGASPPPGYCDGIIRADGPGHTRSLSINGGGNIGGPSRFGVQVVVRDLPGAPVTGAGTIPAWVPQYPGGTPGNVVARQAGGERSANFNFATTDDARKVIDWYERQLKAVKFTIVTSTVFDANTAKLTAQDASGRSILNIRIEPAGGRKVVAVEARDAAR